MNWTNLWIKLFGTTTWMGLDMGFWVSMGISLLVALLMIVVFGCQKPYKKPDADPAEESGHVLPMTKRRQK